NVPAYTREDRERINTVNASIERRILLLMDVGAHPTCDEAKNVAQQQRLHISHWFYAMDHAFHVQKSELYVQDPRFRAGIEKNTRPGAAEWLQAAINANAARARSEGQ